MTRREDRREVSRQRAEEHTRRRKVRFWAFFIALALYVGVPVLWYGAIEFGFVRPIKTPEFASALRWLSSGFLLVLIHLYLRWSESSSQAKKKLKKESTVSTT